MNILITHISFETFGGAESVVQQIATRLVQEEHNVTIATYKATDEAKDKIKGCRFVEGSYPELKKWVHENIAEFDIVNSHNHPMELLPWPKKTKRHIWNFNEPSFYIMAGMPNNPVEEMIVNDSVNLAVIANKTNEDIYKELYNTPTFLNLYGIDVDFYSSGNGQSIRDKYNLGNSFMISTVAWFNPFKRQNFSVETLNIVKKEVPNAKLILAGKDDGSKEIKDLISKYKLQDSVIITGHVSKEEARDIYFASDVVLCPFARQGGYLTVMEAICSKRPVVVSSDSMLAQDVEENKAAIVTNQLPDAVIEAYYNKTPYDLEKAYQWVSQFTWKRYTDNMMVLFS